MSGILLETKNLCCIRSDRLLFKNLNLTVKAGEVTVVEGRNGSGKTSLLRILSGLALPHQGEVLWQGTKIQEERERYLRHMAYLGHLPAIKSELTALENLNVACRLNGQPGRTHEALAHVGLGGFEQVPTQFLSAGQRRRVALARLLAIDNKLWILDEPLTALDVHGVAMVEGVVAKQANQGGAVIMTTHQPVNLPQDIKVNRLQLTRNGKPSD